MRNRPNTSGAREPQRNAWFLPREHGATAMLLTPMVCAAILSRAWRWGELATLTAAFAALAAKDPAVVLARQRLVWMERHSETAAAVKWLAAWMILLIVSGLVLLKTWPLRAVIPMGLGVGVFSAVAIAANVRNRQRSTWFQIASAAALTSSSLATCLSARGAIAPWCWWMWLLMAMQAAAGILVVHARLDARIALRGSGSATVRFRRAAQAAIVALACAAAAATMRCARLDRPGAAAGCDRLRVRSPSPTRSRKPPDATEEGGPTGAGAFVSFRRPAHPGVLVSGRGLRLDDRPR